MSKSLIALILIVVVISFICGFILGRIAIKKLGTILVDTSGEKDRYRLEIDDLGVLDKASTITLKVKRGPFAE